MHCAPALALAKLGYNILLEKPMSTSREECQLICDVIKASNVIFAVGHVLRYVPYSRKMKEILASGEIGDIINIQHLEPIGWYHYAHSYVRGNWWNQKESSFALMCKSCHDIDWIIWMMGKKCTRVSSFGSLKHFNARNKPAGASSNCLDCSVEQDCPYSAKKLYLDGPVGINSGNTAWPVNVISHNPTKDRVVSALKNGPYGRCVYDCDNDVMDNQVVNMQFEGGATASFSMVAFTKELCVRKTRIFGTLGEIEGDGEKTIKVFNFATQKETVYHPEQYNYKLMSGHGGGDFGLMESFIEAVATNNQELVCGVEETLESHVVVFEAEEARVENTVRNLDW